MVEVKERLLERGQLIEEFYDTIGEDDIEKSKQKYAQFENDFWLFLQCDKEFGNWHIDRQRMEKIKEFANLYMSQLTDFEWNIEETLVAFKELFDIILRR